MGTIHGRDLPFETIGTEGLEGRVFLDMITIRGPCGEGHTMSLNAAAQLRDWLDSKLGGPVVIDGLAEDFPEMAR